MDENDYKKDWIEVAFEDKGGGYDWDIFEAYYSPSARRFFWDNQSGCSCYYWEDPGEGGWSVGDKRALISAMRDYGFAPEDIQKVATFKEVAA